MTLKGTVSTIIFLLLLSCGSNLNSDEFIQKTTGRYLYNSDEVVEVYFEENDLLIKWRGATAITPLKVSDDTFFVKEMNEKVQFLNNPSDGKDYMVLVPKEKTDTLKYNFRKLEVTEKIPSEYLKDKEFDKALEAYLAIRKKDSLDGSLKEGNFNRLGYKELRDENFDEAKAIFKINIALYPESSNVYDSYAEAFRRSGDTITAIEYYKKSIAIDSGNRDAKRFVEKYDKKE